MKCTPKKLEMDLEFLKYFDRVPSMGDREGLILFIKGRGYTKIKGVNSLEEAENDQLFATTNRIYGSIFKRLDMYSNNLREALSSWSLEEWEKNIILNINKKLKNGSEDKGDLEGDLYVKLSHLSEIYDHPLRKLFLVLSKNY